MTGLFLRGELLAALDDLDTALGAGDAGGVSISARAGRAWITVPKLARQPEPANLERLKTAVQTRWGTVDLLDMLVEADHRVASVLAHPPATSRCAKIRPTCAPAPIAENTRQWAMSQTGWGP